VDIFKSVQHKEKDLANKEVQVIEKNINEFGKLAVFTPQTSHWKQQRFNQHR